ncbi:MAG: ROK family protein [Candidatus Borkfalkiaceae bacterium]|nr:ROK family protein [Christensenellaceae bacterium]
MEVINFKAFNDETNGSEYEKLSANNGEIRNLTACKYFRIRALKLNGKYSEKNDKTFTAIDFVSGSGEINGKKFVSGDSFFIPCGEEFTVSGNATAILTTENTLKYYAGIDLGGTGIKCGIVDENGKIVAIKKCPTRKGVEAKDVLLDMANLVKDLQKETGFTIEGVGVGCPGLIDTEKGNVVYSKNLAWKNVPQKAMDGDKESLLWKLTDGNKENVNGKIVFDALREGDKTAEKVVKKYTEYLAAGVTNVINAFHPQAIVLGGGICAAGDVFLTPLKRKVNRGIFGGTKFAPVEIVVASLGNDAGIYGAAALAMN